MPKADRKELERLAGQFTGALDRLAPVAPDSTAGK